MPDCTACGESEFVLPIYAGAFLWECESCFMRFHVDDEEDEEGYG